MDRSRAVIGSWPLSGDWGHVDPRTIQETLERCYELGLREFDTAPGYGNGLMEFFLGKVLARNQDVRINTKMGAPPFWGKSFAVADLKRSFEESLMRLSVDAVNVLFLHNPRNEVTDYRPISDFMDELKQSGRIRYKGISLAKGYPYADDVLGLFDFVQDDANLLYMESLKAKRPPGVRLMARSPLASGLLSGNKTRETTFPSGDHRSGWLKDERFASLVKRVEAIERMSPIGLASLAKRFLLQHERIDRVIFGVKRPGHVDEIVDDLDSPPLDSRLVAELVKLNEIDFGLVNERHLGY